MNPSASYAVGMPPPPTRGISVDHAGRLPAWSAALTSACWRCSVCSLLILWRWPEGTGGAHVVTFDHRTSPFLLTCIDSPPADVLTFRRHNTRPRVKTKSPLDLSALPVQTVQSPPAAPPTCAKPLRAASLPRAPVPMPRSPLSLSFTHHT
jgi:hypothetical protein